MRYVPRLPADVKVQRRRIPRTGSTASVFRPIPLLQSAMTARRCRSVSFRRSLLLQPAAILFLLTIASIMTAGSSTTVAYLPGWAFREYLLQQNQILWQGMSLLPAGQACMSIFSMSALLLHSILSAGPRPRGYASPVKQLRIIVP